MLKELEVHVKHEMEYQKILPLDHQERINLDALFVWMQMSDCKFDKCTFRMNKYPSDFVGDGNRGVKAIDSIKEGEFPMVIPIDKVVLDITRAANTKLAQEMTTLKVRQAILGDNIKVIQSSVLAGFLLHCKKNKVEEWRHYIDTLPESAGHFPEMFSEEDLKWLEGSPALVKF